MPWQSTAAPHVESMSNNSAAELQAPEKRRCTVRSTACTLLHTYVPLGSPTSKEMPSVKVTGGEFIGSKARADHNVFSFYSSTSQMSRDKAVCPRRRHSRGCLLPCYGGFRRTIMKSVLSLIVLCHQMVGKKHSR